MSVDTRAKIVYGWKVSYEEKNKMNEISNYAYEDNFILINAYIEDDRIIGEEIKTVEMGECSYFNVISLFDKIPSDFTNKYNKILKEMGREDLLTVKPGFFLIGQVT